MVAFSPQRAFEGPNPYAAEAGLLVDFDISPADLAFAGTRCRLIRRALAAWFPGHSPDADRQPSETKTPLDLANFLSSLTLAALNEVRGDVQIARAFEEQHRLRAFIGSHHHETTLSALTTVVSLFNSVDNMPLDRVEACFHDVWNLCRKFHPDYQAKMLIQGARSKDIPFFRLIPNQKYWQYGWGKNGRTFFESGSFEDSLFGGQISNNKQVSKSVFEALGVPIVPHVSVQQASDLAHAIAHISFPCVVKPINMGRSIGVTTDITNMADLKAAFAFARQHSSGPIMVERHIPGDVYRIMVIRGQVACIVRREAPFVIGDGRQSVIDLVAAQNRKIRAHQRPDNFIGPIPTDDAFRAELWRQALEPDDIVEAGCKVSVGKVPLLSTGAVYSEVTDQAHPHIVQMAQGLAQSLGISICGIDYITENIGQSYLEGGAVIEVNTVPGLRVPMMAGMKAEQIGAMILGDGPGRINVTLILCPKALHPELRTLLAIPPETGWVIGDEAGIDAMPLPPLHMRERQTKSAPYARIYQILRNPKAGRLLIVSDLQTITTHGLPVDRCDVLITCGKEADPEWQAVLGRYALHYSNVKTPQEAAEIWNQLKKFS